MGRSLEGLTQDSFPNTTGAEAMTISYSSTSFSTNNPLISAFVAFDVAQTIKLITSWCKEKHWDLKQLVGSGACFVPIGYGDCPGILHRPARWFQRFPLRRCLSPGVLNQIVYELPAEHPLAESRPLRELLGHTPPQGCAGAILGMLISTIGHLISGFGDSNA